MGIIIVFAQIILFIALFLFCDLLVLFLFPYLIIFTILGLALSLWGVLSIGINSYSPFPNLRKTNVFTKRGAYRFVRHPIYAGLIFVGLAMLLSRLAWFQIAIFSSFVWLTDYKANIEEELLTKKYREYKNYRQRVSKFIPFFW